MNAQRWLALGMLVLIILCIATSNLWLARLRGDTAGAETPAPEATTVVEEGEAEEEISPEITPTPTLNPVIVEIMADLQMQGPEVGIEPFITRAGNFVTIDPMHRAVGTASIYQISETQRVLRLDPFSVSSGPDLRLILSAHPAPRTSAEALLPTFLDLGPLKSTSGAQNYEIPADQDITLYQSVVIYSMSLNMIYSTATLEDVRGQ